MFKVLDKSFDGCLWCFTDYFPWTSMQNLFKWLIKLGLFLCWRWHERSVNYHICLALGKSSNEKQKFSWSHAIKLQGFCRLQHHEILSFWKRMFLIILFCTTEQRYFDLNMKNKFLKNLSSISFTWTLVLVVFLGLVPDIVYRMIKWGLSRLSNDVLCYMFCCIKKLSFQKNGKKIGC